MSFDYLPGTNIYLKQRQDMFRINTDTHLLGKFMEINKKDRVLDIGCNNGALLLYASQYAQQLVGIDILNEAIELAKENLAMNKVEARLYNIKAQDFNDEPFDKIICNPPYFNTKDNGNKNSNYFLEVARHDRYLPLDELFACYKRLLKDNGTVYMVHRPSYLAMILDVAKNYKFKCIRMKMIYDQNKQEAVSVLLAFKIGKTDLIKVEKDEIIR
ncbi:MAG: methyltransferase [Erysipelotrichaceae bacterium]|nr:methyltransferase [Erysipelotrichaceae bacterium]